jgi:hypothetical protein
VNVELEAEPSGAVTVIKPDVAPSGTDVSICVSEIALKAIAGAAPNITEVTSASPVPTMLTDVPTVPCVVESEEMVGGSVLATADPSSTSQTTARIKSTQLAITRERLRWIPSRMPSPLSPRS